MSGTSSRNKRVDIRDHPGLGTPAWAQNATGLTHVRSGQALQTQGDVLPSSPVEAPESWLLCQPSTFLSCPFSFLGPRL